MYDLNLLRTGQGVPRLEPTAVCTKMFWSMLFQSEGMDKRHRIFKTNTTSHKSSNPYMQGLPTPTL